MRCNFYKHVLTFAVSLIIIGNALSQTTVTFTNSTAITIIDGPVAPTAASVYPSTINVSGMTGTIINVNLSISGITHPRPSNIDMLLVGPGGQTLTFWSDAGGTAAANAVTNISFTFSNAAATLLPGLGSTLTTGTFKPTNYGVTEDVFPSPAPADPYNNPMPFGPATFTVFNNLNPNGVWSLYIVDDEVGGGNGTISGGWSLTITTGASALAPVAAINQAASQADPTSSSTINFTAVFNEPVTGFTSSDITLSGTAGATTAVVTEIAPNNGTTYNVAVSGMTTSGTVIASIPANMVVNSANLGNTASFSGDNNVTYNAPPPPPVTVTINQAAGQADPTNNGPVNFTAIFNEPVTGLLSTEVTIGGSALPTSVSITEIAPNNGTTYNIAVSGMSETGTVIASIPANVVVSSTGVANVASTSTDNTVNYTAPPPLPTIQTIFTNSSGITINDNAVANPYPSTINVSGLTGTIKNLTLTITGFTHERPGNVDMVLVGPGGQTLVFWSDIGLNTIAGAVNNVSITFSDAAATEVPNSGPITGTFKPTNYGVTEDVFASPAPVGPYNNGAPFGNFLLNLFTNTNPNGTWSLYVIDDASGGAVGSISGWSLTIQSTLPPLGNLIISEFRLRGPGGTNDEFIEIYNPNATDHTVTAIGGTGYGIASSDGITRASIPNGTLIRAKQHYLVTGSTYSLANYGGTGAAAGNTSYATDIPDNIGLAIFNNTLGGSSYTIENRLDAVGSSSEANTLYKEGTGYPALGSLNLESAIRRKTYSGVPQDSDNNSLDFEFVDNQAAANGAAQKLGAPGPENLNNPVARNAGVVLTRLDQTLAYFAPPNTFRDLALTGSTNLLGTVEFRYRLTNNTGAPLTRIRLRLDSLTSLPIGTGKADLRAMTSTNIIVNAIIDPVTCASTGTPATVPCQVTVLGTTVEQPPVQPAGGGFNSSLSVGTITTGTPLAAGASINIRLLFGIMQPGDFNVSFTPEVLPYTAAIGPVPPPEKIRGATGPTNVTINQAEGQADPTSSSPINFKVVFNGAVTGFTASEVTLSGTAGATTAVVSEIAPNDGTTYNIEVTGMTANGTVIASIPANVAINSGNYQNLASTSTDNTVTYSGAVTAPTVTINQAILQPDPASTSPINFSVLFSQPVTGFTNTDVTLSGTAGATTVVIAEQAPNNGTFYNVAVSGMTTNGTVVASIPAGVVLNAGSVANLASTSSDNTVTYTAPVGGINVTINQAATQSDPAITSPINFTVVFSEAVSGFTFSDVILSGTAGATTAVVTEIAPNNGTTYNVAVSGMTGSGTVIASIPAGIAGNPVPVFNNSSTSTDNTVTYQFSCTIQCPGNITVDATSAAGAVVSYSAPGISGDCGTISSIPASGSVFPVGTTTVNAYNNVPAEIVYGLTYVPPVTLGPPVSQLIRFNVGTPGTVTSPLLITGLYFISPTSPALNEILAAIDFRPSNGQLFGLATRQCGFGASMCGRLYTINTTTGVATPVGAEFPLMGSEFSMDFDPVTDVLRIMADASLGTLLNPNTGAVLGASNSTLNNMVGVAYSNNIPGASSTTMYEINSGTNSLYRQGGASLVGPLNIDVPLNTGFDISSIGTSLASFKNGGDVKLYSINLATGASSLIGNIGNSNVIDIAVAPVTLPTSACSFTVTVNPIAPPTISCPGNITVNADAGTCEKQIFFTGANAITATGSPAPLISYRIDFSNNGVAVGNGVSSFPSSLTFSGGTSTATITATNDGGTVTCTFTVTVIDNQPPVLNCPANITVNAAPGQCSASVMYEITGSENCPVSQPPMTLMTSAGLNATMSGTLTLFQVRHTAQFQAGTTTVTVTATDASGNTATCTFYVTVRDTENPVITSSPGAITVDCASKIPAANIALVTATDNCGIPTITHVGDVISSQLCANKYTVTRTYRATDGAGNTSSVTQLITVDDNTPPQITGLTASKQILAPPNHKMVTVTLDYTISDNCSSDPDVDISVTSNEPVNGTGDGDTDPDWEVIDDHHVRLRAERAAQGTGRIYTITVTVNDGCNAAVSATTEVKVTHNITGPRSGNSFKVGSTVAFTGEFWDVPGNTHTAKWLIDGSTTAKGVVTEPSGSRNGKVAGSYKFTTPGVYKLQMNITDQKGVTTFANTNGDVDAIVVIYDPNGGYTYGGGYFDSPAGALLLDPTTTGKASYGFTMNYFKNATNPKGETQFEFKVGEFEFNALNFEYLVISNSMAQFRGTGKIIGGQSGVGFTMTVVDGELDGTGVDKIRMKIYNRNTLRIIYDNQPGASDAALPIQAVGSNSTIVIGGTNSNPAAPVTKAKEQAEASIPTVEDGLNVTVYPNPAAVNFNLAVNASSTKEKIVMQVIDMHGRVVETRSINANSVIRFGDRYRSGAYLVRIVQGQLKKELKLVKLN